MKKGIKFMLLSSSMIFLAACDTTEEPEVDTTVSTEEVVLDQEDEVVEETSEMVEEDVSEVEEVTEDTTENTIDDDSADTDTDVTDDVTEDTTENPVDDAGLTEIEDATASDEESDASDMDMASDTESETSESDESATEDEAAEMEPVEVGMLNADGDSIGTATFEETEDGVTLSLELEGLEAGEYGMHIHEAGMATAPTFEDAGGHFNPTDVEHGTESETGPHAGDLPNLEVGEDGTVSITIDVPDVTLQPDAENTLNTEAGTALIIHTEADDYESQPTGDAGDRMAGGVIFAPLTDGEETEVETVEDESASDAEVDEAESDSEMETEVSSSEEESSEDAE